MISTIESNASSTANLKGVLHALILLKEVLGVFPKQQLKTACETVLKVMTLGNAVTVLTTFACPRVAFYSVLALFGTVTS